MAATFAPIQPQNTVAPVTAATQPILSLTPGSVISAQVVQALENGLVQVAIDGMVIAALSEVPLQAGTTLQLAVSQVQNGVVRLSIVPSSADAAAALPAVAAGGAAPVSAGSASPVVSSVPLRAPSISPLATPGIDAETVAIASAVQTAAPRQASLAPLYANLPVIAASAVLPPSVQQSAAQLLALRPELSAQLSAGDLREAFQQSGLFLEAALAAGGRVDPSTDLKAALTVFRGVLSNWLAADPQPQFLGAVVTISPNAGQTSGPDGLQRPPATTPPAAQSAIVATTAQPSSGIPVSAVATGAASLFQAAAFVIEPVVASPTLAPNHNTESEPSSPGANTPAAQPDGAGHQRVAANLTLSVLEMAQAMFEGEGAPSQSPSVIRDPLQALQAVLRIANALGAENATNALQTTPGPHGDPAQAPPPFRGAAPSAQPIAASSLPLDGAPHEIGQHLLQQTDAALARQTLLQVASLPDRIDSTSMPSGMHNAGDTTAPRWAFEIPFMTPQGTALAQFAIERDGGGGDPVEAAKRVWRARFTLNIEPTGPVHALVSLVGDKTAVRLWAERPETVAQLRSQSDQLAQALLAATFHPGEIAISDGAPAQAAAVRAGHFLDRAS